MFFVGGVRVLHACAGQAVVDAREGGDAARERAGVVSQWVEAEVVDALPADPQALDVLGTETRWAV